MIPQRGRGHSDDRAVTPPGGSRGSSTSQGFEAFNPLVPRALDRPTAVPLDVDADLAGLDGAKIFAAPDDPADWPRWREQLSRWRDEARARLGYDDRLYRRTDLTWTQSCFVVAQVWLWDELLYDFDRGSFTPERLLADAQERLGGFDGIVLWHAYPVIGIDDRNQLDYYREVPGLRALVDDLHAAGVRVFLDYNPWDTGTRRAGPDAEELAAVVRDLDADGVFLDTLKEGGAELLARLDAVRAGVAVEGESTLPLARLTDHPLSWAQWFADSDVPGAKWYERRHQMHHVRRWHRDHRAELQSAWLNGIGVMVWEVVFSSWVGWNAADAAWLRRMAPVQRSHADLLSTGTWTPLVDLGAEAATAGVYGSLFADGDRALLALVNRGDAALGADSLEPPPRAQQRTGARESGALADLRVIDVSTLFAGPMAAMHLGDLGAEVVKVEHPRRPDPSRGHGPEKDGHNLWWKTLGRNKPAVPDVGDAAGDPAHRPAAGGRHRHRPERAGLRQRRHRPAAGGGCDQMSRPVITLLYVPADQPARVAKALASDADVVIIDLEDAVRPEAKEAARDNLASLLGGVDPSHGLQVRINALTTRWADDDLVAVSSLPPGVGVRIPKCEDPLALDDLDRRLGSRPLHVLVESALGVEAAYALTQCVGVASIGLGEGGPARRPRGDRRCRPALGARPDRQRCRSRRDAAAEHVGVRQRR